MKKKSLLRSLVMTCVAVLMLTAAPFAAKTVQAADALYWPVPGHTTLSQGYHDGKAIDISDSSIAGARVVSAHSGTVTAIFLCGSQHYNSNGDCNGFGTGLVIKGTDGRFYQYAHMKSGSIPSNVYKGAYVSAGQTIGAVGTTGNSSGNHLHFGISTGTYYNNSGINPQNENYTAGTTSSASSQVSLSYSNMKLTSVSTTNACLSAKINNPSGARFTKVGAYIWNASGKLLKNYSESCTLKYTSFNQALNITKEAGLTLSPGTKYYVQFYGVANGQTFKSQTVSFTTNQTVKVTYGALKASFIKTTNAKFYASISNPSGAKITKVGVQVWNKNGKLIKNYTETCNRTLKSFNQYIDLHKEAKMTLTKNTKYYIRFYAIAGSKTFYSKTYNFTTKAK